MISQNHRSLGQQIYSPNLQNTKPNNRSSIEQPPKEKQNVPVNTDFDGLETWRNPSSAQKHTKGCAYTYHYSTVFVFKDYEMEGCERRMSRKKRDRGRFDHSLLIKYLSAVRSANQQARLRFRAATNMKRMPGTSWELSFRLPYVSR